MQFLIENLDTLVAILGGALTLASLVTKLTPSPKDDAVVAKILAWSSFLQPRGVPGLKLPGTPPAAGPFIERDDRK